MAIFQEIQEYINDLDKFKRFLAEQLEENPDFLQQSWNKKGDQVTLLGYLISQHEEASDDSVDRNPNDLTDLILFTLEKSKYIDAGFPLHQAISSNKLELAKAMVKKHSIEDKDSASNIGVFNFDAFDNKGRSVLSLALRSADENLIKSILELTNTIYETSIVQVNDQKIKMQPIHQAIYLNLLPAVHILIEKGAQLDNACGPEKNTPVMLAAKSGQCEVLKLLLCSKVELDLEVKNDKSYSAVGLACEALKFAKTPESKDIAIKSIAMLLCHGAEVPQLDLLRNVLLSHRDALLQAMGDYLLEQPKLLVAVVNRIHDKNSRLHSLVYENNAVVSFFQHLGNKPNHAALTVESWVRRNAEGPASGSQLENDKIKFAEFVRRYDDQYKAARFSNPWSSMRGKLFSGEVTSWEDVVDYADNHKKSRTKAVLESFKEGHDLHAAVDDSGEGLGNRL